MNFVEEEEGDWSLCQGIGCAAAAFSSTAALRNIEIVAATLSLFSFFSSSSFGQPRISNTFTTQGQDGDPAVQLLTHQSISVLLISPLLVPASCLLLLDNLHVRSSKLATVQIVVAGVSVEVSVRGKVCTS